MIFDAAACINPATGAAEHMKTIYLLTGGNLGDREESLRQAAGGISRQAGEIFAVSGLYETAPWGIADQPLFLNQAIGIHTMLPPIQLLDRLQELERKIGRVRAERYGPRVIDIDILLYDNEQIDVPRLRVPHPLLPERRFALMPLAEIAPALIHPVSGMPIAGLLAACDDPLRVHKLR